MAPRDPTTPQLDFPQLTADIIEQLRLTGTVGLLNFLDGVRPVYIAAARENALDLPARFPVFRSSEIFSNTATNPALNAVLADTGQLAAGTYDVRAMVSTGILGAPQVFPVIDLQHRDAANLATLSSIPNQISVNTNIISDLHAITWTYATVIAANERLRFQLTSAAVTNGRIGTVIMAARRAEP